MAWGDSWGSSPSRSARDVAAAFYAGRNLKRSGCETSGTAYRYKTATIARRIKPEDLPHAMAAALEGNSWVSRPLEFRFAFCDKAVARHLCALGLSAEYVSKKDGPRINGKLVDTDRWYTLDEIAALPADPPAPPKVRDTRCNKTLELFT